jgi:hypothetical protein
MVLALKNENKINRLQREGDNDNKRQIASWDAANIPSFLFGRNIRYQRSHFHLNSGPRSFFCLD